MKRALCRAHILTIFQEGEPRSLSHAIRAKAAPFCHPEQPLCGERTPRRHAVGAWWSLLRHGISFPLPRKPSVRTARENLPHAIRAVGLRWSPHRIPFRRTRQTAPSPLARSSLLAIARVQDDSVTAKAAALTCHPEQPLRGERTPRRHAVGAWWSLLRHGISFPLPRKPSVRTARENLPHAIRAVGLRWSPHRIPFRRTRQTAPSPLARSSLLAIARVQDDSVTAKAAALTCHPEQPLRGERTPRRHAVGAWWRMRRHGIL